MKKIGSILIAAAFVFSAFEAMAAVEVNTLKGEVWTCSGTADKDTLITAVLYKGETVGSKYEDVLGIADTYADEENKFSININIFEKNLTDVNKITALVRIGDDAETKTFTYAGSEERNEILNSFHKDSENNNAEAYNKIVPLAYGDVSWDDVKNKSFVSEYMNENGPYKTDDEVQNAFAKGYAYSEINALDTHGKVKSTLGKFEDLLELEKLDYYDDYKKVSNNSSVNRKFVSVIEKEPVTTNDELDSVLKKAADAADEKKSSGGGSGGGGGSKISAGSVVAPVVKNESSKTEPENEAVQVFTDISPEHWAYEAVMNLYNSGDINGYEDGTFRPDKAVTREEFVKMMLSSLKIAETGGTVPFDDVEYGVWYSTYVTTAWRKGLVNGISKDKFGLGMSITRQDMATMIYRAANLSDGEGDAIEFADGNYIAEYAKEAVEVLSKAGVINGIDGSFMPEKTATRAEVAKILSNMLALR